MLYSPQTSAAQIQQPSMDGMQGISSFNQLGSFSSALNGLNIFGLSSQTSSLSSNFTADFSCPGIKLPNIGNLLSRLSQSILGCQITAKQQNLECLNQKINTLNNPTSIAPLNYVARGVRGKVNAESCTQYAGSVSVDTLREKRLTPGQRIGNSYRECLSMGGNDCYVKIMTLPTNMDAFQKDLQDSVKILTGSDFQIFSASGAKEREMAKTLSSNCQTAKCAADNASQADKDLDKSIKTANSETSAGLYKAVQDATSPRYYAYDPSEAAKKLYPVELQREYTGSSIRAMAIETLSRSFSSEINELRVDITITQNNKTKTSAMPVIAQEINKYASEVADAR